MIATPPPAEDLAQFVDSLLHPTALVELAALVGCLLAAWVIVRVLRGAQAAPGSVLFGRSVVDGVLFPVVALVLALIARRVMQAEVHSGVFRLVLPMLTSLVVIRLTVRVLGSAFPKSEVMRVVERSVSWIAWIAVALWITGVLPLVLAELDDISWKVGTTQISVRNIIEGSLSAVVVLMIALWVSAAIEAQLLKGATDNISIRKMAANSVRALLLFVGLLLAMSAAGIDLTALGVLGGALGVGIGFGLQKLAANYISGFVILAERSVRIGDMVKVDGFEGRITEINTRYTLIRALTGRESIVPNEMLITQRVENSSLADPNVVVETAVQVGYGTDLDVVLPALAKAIVEIPRVLAVPAPNVYLRGFGADGLDLLVNFWINDPDRGSNNVRSEVNLVIWRELNAMGVEIPFPQRVVRQLTPPGAVTPQPEITPQVKPA